MASAGTEGVKKMFCAKQVLFHQHTMQTTEEESKQIVGHRK